MPGDPGMPFPESHGSRHGWTPARQVNGGKFIASNFFIFLCGQLVTFLIGVGIFFVAYGRQAQRFEDLSDRVARLEASARRMDDSGTNYSHYHLESELGILTQNSNRIGKVEDYVNRIGVMDEKITRIEGDIKDIKANLRK